MADLSFECSSDCNLLGQAMKDASPREAVLAVGKLLRIHYKDATLTAEAVEMYLSLVASYLQGPGAGAPTSRLESRRAERIMR